MIRWGFFFFFFFIFPSFCFVWGPPSVMPSKYSWLCAPGLLQIVLVEQILSGSLTRLNCCPLSPVLYYIICWSIRPGTPTSSTTPSSKEFGNQSKRNGERKWFFTKSYFLSNAKYILMRIKCTQVGGKCLFSLEEALFCKRLLNLSMAGTRLSVLSKES